MNITKIVGAAPTASTLQSKSPRTTSNNYLKIITECNSIAKTITENSPINLNFVSGSQALSTLKNLLKVSQLLPKFPCTIDIYMPTVARKDFPGYTSRDGKHINLNTSFFASTSDAQKLAVQKEALIEIFNTAKNNILKTDK